MKLRQPVRFTVAHCVTDGPALLALLDVLHEDQLQGRPLHPRDGHNWWESDTSRCVDLIVYDLTPFDQTAWVFVRRLRAGLPGVPILLYPPARRGVGRLLGPCARLPLIEVELQGVPVSKLALRTAIRRSIDAAPAAQVLRVMRSVLPGRPPFVTSFLLTVLFGLQARRFAGLPRLADIARQLATTRRSLERAWKANALASPKELLDWATLLLVTRMGAMAGIGSAAAARGLGLDTQHLYRLRRRLVPGMPRETRSDADAEFSAALVRFATLAGQRRLPTSRLVRTVVA